MKTKLLALILVLHSSINTFATYIYDFQIDGIYYWIFSSSDKTASVLPPPSGVNTLAMSPFHPQSPMMELFIP